MKHPNRYVGIIEYKSTDYPFEFFENDFKLSLYRSSKEDMFKHQLDALLNIENKTSNEWIEPIQLKAVLSDGKQIIFCVTGIPSYFNAFITFDVLWFCYYGDDKPINGIRISGDDVDCYYSPHKAYSKLSYCHENNTFIGMNVDVVSPEETSCGNVRINDKELSVSVVAIATMHYDSNVPLDSKSYIYAQCNETISLEDMIHLQWSITSYLKYVCYRKNLTINEIELFTLNEDGLREYFGFLCFPNRNEIESDTQKYKISLKHTDIKELAGGIITDIANELIPLQHICESIENRRHYPISRIIVLFSAFEREFYNIYGQDAGRSEVFQNTKNEIIDLLNTNIIQISGKKRDYYKEIIRTISNINTSYGSKIRHAINSSSDIMKLVIENKYGESSYEEVLEGFCERVNTLRNGLAHSRLDLQIEPINLTDLKVLEELIYVMRLKASGVDSINIINSINNLFREHIANIH